MSFFRWFWQDTSATDWVGEDPVLFFQNNPELAELDAQLCREFSALAHLKSLLSLHNYLENLNWLYAVSHMLAEAPGRRLLKKPWHGIRPLRCLDVGVKNWTTAPALATLLYESAGESFELSGIELAPERKNPDGSLCGDRALENSEFIRQAKLLPGDVCRLHQGYDVISLWSPYLFEESFKAEKLPLELFKPQALLSHLITTLLAPGGTLLISNQDPLEFQTQADMLVPFDIQKHFAGPLPQPFLPLPYTRFGWLFTKPAR